MLVRDFRVKLGAKRPEVVARTEDTAISQLIETDRMGDLRIYSRCTFEFLKVTLACRVVYTGRYLVQ